MKFEYMQRFMNIVKFICLFVSVKNQIIPTKFRRAYISVGIRGKTSLTPNNCGGNVEITIIDIKRYFWIGMACNDMNKRLDFNLEDYTEDEIIFAPNLKITFTYTHAASSEVITINEILNIMPNTEKSNEFYKAEFNILVIIIYRCQGYYGYNCHYEIPLNPKIEVNLETSIPLCKDPNDCVDRRCDDQSICLNGVCYEETFDPETKYCICNENFYGDKCQHAYVQRKMVEDMLIFSTEEELPDVIETSNCQHCYGKKCKIYDDFTVCIENDELKKICECLVPCIEICGPYICKKEIYDEITYYLHGMKNSNIS